MNLLFSALAMLAVLPSASAQAATLEEALTFLRDKLATHGSYLHSMGGGAERLFEYETSPIHLSSCDLSYAAIARQYPRLDPLPPSTFFQVHEVVLRTINDENDVKLEASLFGQAPGPESEVRLFTYPLAEMDPTRIDIVTYNDPSHMYSVTCPSGAPCGRLRFASFRFTDLGVARRVQRAVQDAIWLCGGRPSSPY